MQLTSGKLATNAHNFLIHHLKPLIQPCLVKISALVKFDIWIACWVERGASEFKIRAVLTRLNAALY